MRSDELWVFGYGSLMWNPGFEHDQTEIAEIADFHRSFCMRSIHHRGSVDVPGLVLALDKKPGVNCRGMAFRVTAGHEQEALAELRAREMISSAYKECVLPVRLSDGREVMAVTYVIEPDHEQYCSMSLTQQAEIIATAQGGRGPNSEYLFNTAQHLVELGIEDPELSALAKMVNGLLGH